MGASPPRTSPEALAASGGAVSHPSSPGLDGRLATRDDLYRELLNALPAAIYTTDAKGRVTFYNEAAAELAGRRPQIGVDEWCVTWRLYSHDGAPMRHDECPMAVALKEGRDVRGVEAWAERPDGSRVCFAPHPTVLRDNSGAVVGAVNMLVDITHQKSVEARQKLLVNEVNHRANNLLAVVQATLRLTEGPTPEALRAALEGRIAALALAHELLASSGWQAADLNHLIVRSLAPFTGCQVAGQKARAWTTGPVVALHASEIQTLAVILHELATNAERFGALSVPCGRVLIDWREGAGGGIILGWRETDGPPIGAGHRAGVGERIIRGAVAQLGGAVAFDWQSAGLACRIELQRRLTPADPPALH